MVVFLVVSLFIEDIVRIKIFGKQFFPPIYWQGVEIVPWILLAYVFTGAYVVFVVGIYLEKKTKFLPLVSGLGALLNIGANFLLIPRIGILGAAISTLLSYIVMACGMYFTSQRFYRVEYEWSKVQKIAISAGFIFGLFKLINPEPLDHLGILIKIALLSIYIILLRITRIIDSDEIKELKTIFRRMLNRNSSLPNLDNLS